MRVTCVLETSRSRVAGAGAINLPLVTFPRKKEQLQSQRPCSGGSLWYKGCTVADAEVCPPDLLQEGGPRGPS